MKSGSGRQWVAELDWRVDLWGPMEVWVVRLERVGNCNVGYNG